MKTTGIRVVITDREVAALALAAIVVAVFSNCMAATFVWDDAANILDNVRLASWSGIPKLFSETITAGAGISGGLYRPLLPLTYFLDLRLWGLDPWGYHLTSVLLHAAATVSVFYWLVDLAPLPGAALAALLFSLHPMQTEIVANISGRGDTMAILFACAGLRLFASRPKTALACALLAILSKENAVMFPVLLWLQGEAAGRPAKWRDQAPFWILSAAYTAFHLLLFRFDSPPTAAHGAMAEFASHPLYRLFTYLPTLPMGLRLWLWPTDLHHERSWVVYQSLAGSVWKSLVGLALWLAAAAWSRRRYPAVTAGLLWFVIATLPTSNLFIVINALFYDHWFIFPGLGLALVFSQLVPKSGRPRTIAIAAGLALACACAAVTRGLNAVWRDSYTLNSYILRYEPRSAKIHNNLAAAFLREERWQDGIEQLRMAIALDDEYPQAHHNLAKAYDALNRETEAAVEFQRAIDMNPSLIPPRVCLGWLELRQGHSEQAEKVFDDALHIRPYTPSAWLGLAQIRLQRGDRAGAFQALRDGQQWAPGDPRIARALDEIDTATPAADIYRTWADSVR